MVNARRWQSFFLVSVFACALGCDKTERIEHYTLLKPPPVEFKDRTLAAMVLTDEQGWFFKLVGPKDAVAAKGEEFQTFLKSIHFSDGKPAWTLPTGWQEQAGSGMRYATLMIPGEEKPLEVSVTSLPKSPGNDEAYILSNINRWRGQMGLPPITIDQIGDESVRVELTGSVATMVNLLGTAAPANIGRGPFSSGAGNGN